MQKRDLVLIDFYFKVFHVLLTQKQKTTYEAM